LGCHGSDVQTVKKGYLGSSTACACSGSARFVNYRNKTVTSLIGSLRLSRPYYHCPHCGQSQKPWDEKLQLGERGMTPTAAEPTALAGVLTGFEQATERTLKRMSGIVTSESTVQRTTEDAGRRLSQLQTQDKSIHPYRPWGWQRDKQGKTCAYISVDHTGVRRQGPKGSAAEGRTTATAMVYNPPPDDAPPRRKPPEVRYLAGFLDWSWTTSADNSGGRRCRSVGIWPNSGSR